MNLEALFNQAGYSDFLNKFRGSIQFRDDLRGCKTHDYAEKLEKILSERYDVCISTEYLNGALGALIRERYPIVFLQIMNGLLPPYAADIGLFVNSGNGAPESRSVSEWREFKYIYGRPKNLTIGDQSSRNIITVAKDIDRRVSMADLQAFGSVIENVLQKHPGTNWRIVGAADNPLRTFLAINGPTLNSRLEIIEYDIDIGRSLSDFAIFVLPRIPGGGRVAAWAAMSSVPIVVFQGSDAVPFAGKAGVVEDYDALQSEIIRILGDDHYRNMRAKTASSALEFAAQQASTREFIDACKRAIQLAAA